jgi:predicted DNA-binding transcriptional regulator AlpA
MAAGEMLPIEVDEPCLVTAVEVAKLLHVSTRTLWRLRSGGQMPQPVRLGGAVRWRIEDIKNWIAAGCPAEQARENERHRR